MNPISRGSLVFINSLLKSEPKFRQNASEFTVVKQVIMMSGRVANDDRYEINVGRTYKS